MSESNSIGYAALNFMAELIIRKEIVLQPIILLKDIEKQDCCHMDLIIFSGIH